MANLLFECLSEEVPAKMQLYAAQHTEKIITSQLKKLNLTFFTLKVFFSPRRLTILIKDLPSIIDKKLVEVKGPKVNATEKAISGFLNKVKKNLDDLEVKSTDKGDFYFLKYYQDPQPLEIIIQTMVEDFLTGFYWPKSMRWGNNQVRWVRPVTNLLCLLDGNVVPVEFAGMKATNHTYGHKFKSGKIEVSSVDDYLMKLRDNYVILDQEERLSLIKQRSLEIAEENGLYIDIDDELLREITGLVEYPIVLMGKIDQKFMDLPKDLLIIVMRDYQRYHYLLDENRKIAPFFLLVSNNGQDANVIKGNEKVLKARLADAKFLVDSDLKNKLASYNDKLGSIMFHTKLGSIKEKVDRVTVLSKYISFWVPNASIINVEKAAHLMKADLATAVVKEFSKLQGVIGGYYAECENENQEVVKAIEQHYYPLNADSACTVNPVAVALSIADKVDSIVGLIAAGEKVSGSRDPLALRRSATGIVRTIIENNITLPLDLAIEKAASLYKPSVFKKRIVLKIKKSEIVDKLYRNTVVKTVIDFCDDRLKYVMKSQNIEVELIDAIASANKHYVPCIIYKNAISLSKFFQNNDGAVTISAYKRMNSILNTGQEGERSDIFSKKYNPELFVDDGELEIASKLSEIKPKIKTLIKEHNIESSLDLLLILAVSINKFLDKVQINHSSTELCNNRLYILSSARRLFNKVVDFKKLLFI